MMYKGTIPTAYDKDNNRFEHHGKVFTKIYFSVAYKGEAAGSSSDGFNACVDIPWVGYSAERSLTIKGIKFTVRTGPKYLSVKTGVPVVCKDHETVFAYYVSTPKE